jgi:hypothetical protein
MPAHDHSHHDMASPQASFWTSRTFFVSLAFLVVAVFLLLSEHRAHFLGVLPLLLLLALCPLLHVFMHGGHGGHSGHSDQQTAEPQSKAGDKS